MNGPAWCAACHHPMPDTACPRCGGTVRTTEYVDLGDPDGWRHGQPVIRLLEDYLIRPAVEAS